MYPPHLQRLIQELRRLPGVGTKSAERFAFELIEWSDEQLSSFAKVIAQLPEKIVRCSCCGCLKEAGLCRFCDQLRPEQRALCLVTSPKDVFAIEQTGEYRGLYHVLGALLSPLEGIGPESLQLDSLTRRIEQQGIEEVILALDSTLEGDTTALWLKRELSCYPVTISRLALGLPMGSSLGYIDRGTLARAFTGRGKF